MKNKDIIVDCMTDAIIEGIFESGLSREEQANLLTDIETRFQRKLSKEMKKQFILKMSSAT